MRNVRAELEKELRGQIADHEWAELVEENYVAEVLKGMLSVSDVAERVRHLRRTWGRGGRLAGRQPLPARSRGAVSARIDALSAIYAHWAEQHIDVRWFRERTLTARDTPEYLAWIDQEGPQPQYRLLQPGEVGAWVLAEHNELDADGNGDDHVRGLIAQTQPGERKVKNLWYIDDRQERVLTVDARSTLGDLARLADKLADSYRWWSSEAATFVLTGRVPEVHVYMGSAPIRHGENAATTRVTMVLDPFLTPDQVADIYTRLRAQVSPKPPRSLSAKHYRLAQHIGPRVRFFLAHPSQVTRSGRRPQASPSGLAHFIEPTDGHTWQSLCRDWNEQYGGEQTASGRTWRYDAVRNFNRDAKDALMALLYPGWERPAA